MSVTGWISVPFLYPCKTLKPKPNVKILPTHPPGSKRQKRRPNRPDQPLARLAVPHINVSCEGDHGRPPAGASCWRRLKPGPLEPAQRIAAVRLRSQR